MYVYIYIFIYFSNDLIDKHFKLIDKAKRWDILLFM